MARAIQFVLLALTVALHGCSSLEFTAWFYDKDHDLYTDSQVIAVSDYFGLNSLYYSVSIRKCNNESGSYDPAYEDLVKQRILALHANGIATRLYLLQDVGFLDGTYGPTAWVEHIDAANNFLQRNRDVAEAVLGLHFDLEPHQNPNWSTNQTELFGMFMSLLHEVGTYVRDGTSAPALAHEELSIDVPHWFKGQPYATGFPTDLLQYNYTVAFMIYGGTGAQLFNYFGADSELEDIAGLIGIGVEEFASTSDMLAMRHAVVTRFEDVHGDMFKGVALYHFRHLAEAHAALAPWSFEAAGQGLPCLEARSWGALFDDYPAGEMETGGLGNFMVLSKFEVWSCFRDHPCVAHKHGTALDYMCYIYHETKHLWLPWDLNSKLQLWSP